MHDSKVINTDQCVSSQNVQDSIDYFRKAVLGVHN